MGMKTEIKALWVADLRAKPELQGKDSLCREGKFCCLGRLCEVHRVVTGKGEWSDGTDEWNRNNYIARGDDGKHSDDAMELPEHVMKWAGLSSQNPFVFSESGLYGLATINDNDLPFPQIADLIEEQL